jgi:hypothetical protein
MKKKTIEITGSRVLLGSAPVIDLPVFSNDNTLIDFDHSADSDKPHFAPKADVSRKLPSFHEVQSYVPFSRSPIELFHLKPMENNGVRHPGM